VRLASATRGTTVSEVFDELSLPPPHPASAREIKKAEELKVKRITFWERSVFVRCMVFCLSKNSANWQLGCQCKYVSFEGSILSVVFGIAFEGYDKHTSGLRNIIWADNDMSNYLPYGHRKDTDISVSE